MEAKKIPNGINLWQVFLVLAVLLGIILVINIIIGFQMGSELNNNVQAAREKSKPAIIELMIVKNSKCNDCYDVSEVVGKLKELSANFTKQTEVELDSGEGRQILGKYNIDKVPAIIMTGEIKKVNAEGMEKRGDALVIDKFSPPYTNVSTGKIEGRVSMVILKDDKCTKCNGMETLINEIKGAGIGISNMKTVLIASDEGKDLIKKYKIGFVPVLLLSKDASVYDIIQRAWGQVGSKDDDGSYVTRVVYPPFINLTTGELKGIVNVVYVVDKSCTECYDPKRHREIITSQQGFSVSLDKEEVIDINDAKGKELISKYNITQAPTVILSREVSAYPSGRLLKQFFSVEKDGSFVFRKNEQFGTYRDLTNNTIVKFAEQNQQQ